MPQTYLWVIFHGGKTAFVIKLHEFTYKLVQFPVLDLFFFFFKLTLNADIEMLILKP